MISSAKNNTGQGEDITPVQWGSSSIGGPRHWFRENYMVNLFSRHFPPPAQVVDAGCGGGSLSLRLQSRGYRVYSFDLSHEFIKRLRSGFPAGSDNQIEGVVGSAESVPLFSESTDALVCGEVLEHLEDDCRALNDFFRVLRPGGYCLLSVPAGGHLWDESDIWAGHRRRYDRGELEAKVREAGFEVELVRWWGFPFLRLYHKWIFLPWIRRSKQRPQNPGQETKITKLGKSTFVSKTLGGVFNLDRLFSRVPWGMGTILLARKPN